MYIQTHKHILIYIHSHVFVYSHIKRQGSKSKRAKDLIYTDALACTLICIYTFAYAHASDQTLHTYAHTEQTSQGLALMHGHVQSSAFVHSHMHTLSRHYRVLHSCMSIYGHLHLHTHICTHTEQTLQGLLLNALESFPQTKGPVTQSQSVVSLQPPGMLGAETGEGRKHPRILPREVMTASSFPEFLGAFWLLSTS